MSLDTLRSQAFGAKNYELVGILTQRGTLICSLLMIPCGLSWFFATGPVLRGIGVDEEIVELKEQVAELEGLKAHLLSQIDLLRAALRGKEGKERRTRQGHERDSPPAGGETCPGRVSLHACLILCH